MSNIIDMRDAFFDRLYEYISKDKNIVVLTADHGAFGLKKIEKDYPAQYCNTGICEQNMISVAAGLASCGKKVYAYAINNFVSLRTLEQINVDICSMNLDVNIIGVGAGFTYSTDGPTHHGVQDVAMMCNLPNLGVYNVSDVKSSQALVELSYEKKGPKYFRIEKGLFPDLYNNVDKISTDCNQLRISEPSSSTVIIATGYMSQVCAGVLDNLKKEENLDMDLLDVLSLKPLPKEKIVHYCREKKVIIIEENLRSGGLGEKIAALLKINNHQKECMIISIPDGFHFHFGSREYLHSIFGIDSEGIRIKVSDFVKERKNKNSRFV
ncbi:MAG: hypothetical protein CMB80_09000 [Flammeovirgaceae bacterium]|nr:hypothetical protein [Flammeovirgaceae bacterium]|tara:strand:- start:2595 stop:3566 length:972 start_codon:yes stop_codon:yes gene_type:complete